MPTPQELAKQCPNRLPGHGQPGISMKHQLVALADSLSDDILPDVYGEGEYIAGFESNIAGMFGFSAGVFMPSGTMAQQIALRIWCDRKQNNSIAMHPTAHLETAEQFGYQRLHQLKRLQFGVPELIWNRILIPADFESLTERPAAVLLELPARPLGGQLPAWDELVAIRAWCDQHNVALHLDGARIWSCLSFYQKSFAEIGALFDSIYVSFYKDLGGICGCVLMGSEDFIDESRIWQRRHGGNLFTQFPFVASAKQGLAERLPKMASWVKKAIALAATINQVEGALTNPVQPHCNMFQLFLKGEPEALQARHDELSQTTGTYLFGGLSAAQMPGYAMTEIHCWENAMSFDESALNGFLTKLLAPG
ncbi:MAG: threonine aldolase [Candidatus Azotimanducaceae bacterium]|jgi:threonine aldolase